MSKYNPQEIEPKWQKYWEENNIFVAQDFGDKPKRYVLDMFPYPSGAGLHVGHPEGYTATDIYCRYLRLKGFNVLHPMGWDAFGLPAENYAIKTGTHPRITTEKNIDTFRRQIKSFGFSYDWSREVDTTDQNYYKWTQWIFLQLFKKGLAYEAIVPINFCPSCKTGLANEEVKDGKCDRCGAVVERKDMRQWMLKITAYADRLLAGVDKLDWPESIKALQRNWIGKSEGTNVDFKIEGFDDVLTIYTTRVDTLFSGAFMVLAPENPLVKKITIPEQQAAINDYIDKTINKSDLERTDLNKEKTGEFTGSYAINPINGARMPIWISDFVLAGYGTGAVFADAHDERDFELAKKYNIPLTVSIRPQDDALWEKVKNLEACYIDDGILVNSGEFDGLTSADAREKITAYLEKNGQGKKAINYKLRDWVFSRQRYWGEPIPLVHCDKCGTVALDEKDLPLLLPEVEKYEPTGTGESPLAAISEWVNTTCPKCGGPAKRETNTMPQWAGSSWYWLRYIDPKNDQVFADQEKLKYWLPVDVYVGGAEHAVLHLLYARFWNMVLFDLGVVPVEEPFTKLVNQGLILGEDGEKMSKSRGNVVNPDDIIKEYGADAFRMYEMFMGPLEDVKPWSTSGIVGINRFLEKTWNLLDNQNLNLGSEAEVLFNQTIKKVGEDINAMRFNTAISAMMILLNKATEQPIGDQLIDRQEFLEKFILILSPFAPHLAEEIWQKLGHQDSIALAAWPEYDETKIRQSTVEIVVQINGKVRGKIKLSVDASEEEATAAAKAEDNVSKYLTGVTIKKTIFVKNKLISFVI